MDVRDPDLIHLLRQIAIGLMHVGFGIRLQIAQFVVRGEPDADFSLSDGTGNAPGCLYGKPGPPFNIASIFVRACIDIRV